MPYNPGVNDISGQLRAQGMMRGGEGLLAGLTGGINALQQKKEEDKANIASIKSFESMMKGLEGIADQLDPKFKEAVDNVRIQVSDPALSNKQRAQIGAQGMKGITELMKIGADVKQQNAIAEQNRLVNQARMDSERAQMQKAQQEQFIGNVTGRLINSGLKITPEIQAIAATDPNAFAIAMSKATDIANKGVYEKKGQKGDAIGTYRIDPIRGLEEFNQDVTSSGVFVTRPRPADVAQTAGAFGALEQAANGGGGPETVPGSLADVAAQKARADKAALDAKEKLAKENTTAKATNVLNVVEEAIRYVDAGSGGPMDSAFSSVGKYLNPAKDAYAGGMGGTDRLKNRIEVLKSNLSLSSLMALKEQSPTGASGLGSVTKPEFEALQQQLAKLDASQPEHVQRRDLIEVGKEFARMAGIKWEGPSSGGKDEPAATTKKKSGSTADEIADKWLRK
jgi:hypothetical protein